MRQRDPRRDPRAGDVVCVGFERREVIEITEAGAIHYRGDRYQGLCPLKMWRAWCGGRSALDIDPPAGRGAAATGV